MVHYLKRYGLVRCWYNMFEAVLWYNVSEVVLYFSFVKIWIGTMLVQRVQRCTILLIC